PACWTGRRTPSSVAASPSRTAPQGPGADPKTSVAVLQVPGGVEWNLDEKVHQHHQVAKSLLGRS
ncbi:MAG: hypothetical protein ACXW3S_10350, partial [Rhodoplanes sp.]